MLHREVPRLEGLPAEVGAEAEGDDFVEGGELGVEGEHCGGGGDEDGGLEGGGQDVGEGDGLAGDAVEGDGGVGVEPCERVAEGVACGEGGGGEDQVRVGEFVGAGAGGKEASDCGGYVLRWSD